MTREHCRAGLATVLVSQLIIGIGCAEGESSSRPGSGGSSGRQTVAGAGPASPSPNTVTGSAGTTAVAGSTASAGSVAGTGGRAANGGEGGRGGRAGTNAPAAGSGGRANEAGSIAANSGAVWMPKPGTTWQWQLTGDIDTSIDAQMYDIDLYTSDPATIQTLHDKGHKVVCYFSAGTYEPGRPDSAALEKTGLGMTLDGWPDEKWLDVRKPAVRELMKARLDLAKNRKCDGVEPDNIDGYDNENGLGLIEKDGLDYDKFLASEAHARGLSIGLKNSLGLVSDLVSVFDWALNEECLQYDECEELTPFIKAGKAVFHCEYGSSTKDICGKTPQGFSSIVKRLDLDAHRLTCE